MINLRLPNIRAVEDRYIQAVKDEYNRHMWGKKNIWNLVNAWTIANIGQDFESLLRNDKRNLKHLVGQLNITNVPAYILDFKTTYEKFASKNDGIGVAAKKDRFNAYHLLEFYGHVTCPFCNVNLIRNRVNIGKRSSQLDHFFDKDSFPFFALCFYNLVPSCAACNHNKGNQSIDASPFDINSISDLSTFSYQGVPQSLNSLVIDYTATGDMIANEVAFDMKGYYKDYQVMLRSLLIKAQTQNDTYVQSILNNYQDIVTEEQALEILFETVFEIERFYTYSNSKFKYDILKNFFNI